MTFLSNYHYNIINNIQIHTTGCELCISDAYKFANTLPEKEKAIIVNTCSFLEQREKENDLLLNLLSKSYSDYKFYILGCDVNNNKSKYNNFENVLTNEEVSNIIETHISKYECNIISNKIYLKIQDGCRNKCSFCIINQLRKIPHSLPYDEIINTLKLQVKNNKNIIVELAGTEICNYYDPKYKYKISDILREIIKEIPNISQIILPSLDPASLEVENIIKFIDENRDKMVSFIHLAVQSGSDTILNRMKRRHNVERIKHIHHLAFQKNIGIGWDIIVGFPTETDELFNETVNLIKELKPISRTIFEYSPRKGTEAYNMSNQIDDETKHKRVSIIKQIINENKLNNTLKKQYDIYIDDINRHNKIYSNYYEHLCNNI